MGGVVTIKDRQFKPYIGHKQIAEAVGKMAERINRDLANEFPLFLVVLNGSFMFAADLLKEVTIPCGISFVKVASYAGLSSTGAIRELIGLTEDISGRTVVIVEDIVDSGATVEILKAMLQERKAKDVKVATALFKPAAFKKAYKVDYIGLEIPDLFVVGYGMDYEGLGRNLKDIHILV